MRNKNTQPIAIIFLSVLFVFLISRLIAYLVIDTHTLPDSLFVTVGGYRLHHFVYGNILILITSFLAIGLRAKINRNWLALFYGIGLGLVLDEFPLWMGDVNQLQSKVVLIPYATTAVIVILTILLISLIVQNRNKSNN
jgi:hypothetical protein